MGWLTHLNGGCTDQQIHNGKLGLFLGQLLAEFVEIIDREVKMMRVRDLLMAWRGESVLAGLWVLQILSGFPGMFELYRTLLFRLVRKAGLFDDAYYLWNNPDIADSKMKALFHYVSYGDKEGRSPMAFFDPVCYRKLAGGWTRNINALLHFTYVGRYRRISPSPWFDVDYYLKNNKDVARAGIDPLAHYLNWGGLEGRSPCANFDGAYYLRNNPDVVEARVNPLMHYLLYGRLEGRRTLPERYPGEEAEMDLEVPSPVRPGEEEWEGLAGRSDVEDAVLDVVVPVYKGEAETLRCIFSVLTAKCVTPFELVVINDASPDRGLAGELERLAGDGLFTLIENEGNKGFVQTVNRGMRLHDTRDVILLNSDTEVYDGWLDRMKDAANDDDRVATVTPLSNNATICSYPRFLHDNPFPLEIEYRELDALVAEVNPGVVVEAPTAVGFCMYIKRKCINDIGLFDEKTFGKGYGEENDFSQRAIKSGWVNVIATNVFVHHWGSVSFQGEKAHLASKALKLVENKHPNYLADVDEFISKEPLGDIYQHIDWSRLLRQKREKNVLLICHGRGGGTEKRLQEDVVKFVNKGFGVFLMRPVPGMPNKATIRHHETRVMPNLSPVEWSDTETLRWLLETLGITDVVSHSFVDFVKEAPVYLHKLTEELCLNWVMNLHDYEAICPRLNLVDDDGMYCNEPGVNACNTCLAVYGSDFEVLDIREWRAQREGVLMGACKVVVPDKDMADRMNRYYPDVNVEVVPHENIQRSDIRVVRREITPNERLRIVVVGAISKMKGFDILRKCARNAEYRGLPLEYVLMGYSLNDKQMEDAGVYVTGKYEEVDAIKRLHELKPDVVWLPSVWPETYSYTLSVALKAGYPVVAFNIGAIARRLREYGQGQLLLSMELAEREGEVNDFMMDYREGVLVCDDVKRHTDEEFDVAVAAAFE